MKLLIKILRHNVNVWQIISFVLANLVGGAIVLLGIQAYRDADRFLAADGAVLGDGQLVITKPVSGMSAITSMLGIEPRFTSAEIDSLSLLPSVSRVGAFTPARCQVRGQIAVGQLNLVTDMFLESVPDDFIDVPLSDGKLQWSASVTDRVVPIIIPRSYLNLYNYGYAATRGLPQLSEGIVTNFPLRLILSGLGGEHVYEARILGFSNKLNTILAPQNFIDEVNSTMQIVQQKQPSRLIVKTRAGRDDSQQLLQYVESRGYVVEGDSDALKMQTLVHGILMALIGVGALVSLLAFYLLVVSILLLIEKNRERLSTLAFLGYPVRRIASPYLCMVAVADVVVWLSAGCAMWRLYPQVTTLLSALSPDFEPLPSLHILLMACVFALAFVFVHSVLICGKVRQVSR